MSFRLGKARRYCVSLFRAVGSLELIESFETIQSFMPVVSYKVGTIKAVGSLEMIGLFRAVGSLETNWAILSKSVILAGWINYGNAVI